MLVTKYRHRMVLLATASVPLVLPMPTLGRTTCQVIDGRTVITLYIAFTSGSDEVIQRWKQEIVAVWNGPTYHRAGVLSGGCWFPRRPEKWEMREFMISHWSSPKDEKSVRLFVGHHINTMIAVPVCS